MARIGEVHDGAGADEAAAKARRRIAAAVADLAPTARRSRRSSAAPTAAPSPVPALLPLSTIQHRLLLSLKPDGDKHRLDVLRDRHHQTHLHYQFHLYHRGRRHLFDSKEQEGAAVALAGLDQVQRGQAVVLRDLSVRLCFLLERQRVYAVEMRVYARVGRSASRRAG